MGDFMSGNKVGAAKAKLTNTAKDPDYYTKLAIKGGSTPTTKPKGFAALDNAKRQEISASGGKAPRRRKQK